MAPVIVGKRGFLALVLWVLTGSNGYRVIIRIATGHSNLLSCFGPRIRALARYFTSAFASVKYLRQRLHPRAKTWRTIWMTGLNPTINFIHNYKMLLIGLRAALSHLTWKEQIKAFDVEVANCWANKGGWWSGVGLSEVEVVRPMMAASANCGHDPQWHYTQCGSAVLVMFTACAM